MQAISATCSRLVWSAQHAGVAESCRGALVISSGGPAFRMRRPMVVMSCARVGMSSSFFTAASSMYCPCSTPPAHAAPQHSVQVVAHCACHGEPMLAAHNTACAPPMQRSQMDQKQKAFHTGLSRLSACGRSCFVKAHMKHAALPDCTTVQACLICRWAWRFSACQGSGS